MLLQRIDKIKEQEKEKEDVFKRTNIQCQKDTLLHTKVNNLTQETATSFNVAEIKLLVRWELSKVTPGNEQALIGMYLEMKNPTELIP